MIGQRSATATMPAPEQRINPARPPRVLIAAPNASSRFGGEALLPLKYFEILRRRGLPAKLIAHARRTATLPFADRPNVIELVENGVDLSTWVAAPRPLRAMETPFRLVFMGRLADWKTVDVTLTAPARCRANGVAATLDLLGDGPERARLSAMVSELGLTEAVRFHGFQPQSVCAGLLAEADALILNSVWECGGAVVPEAMSLGLPVIATDWGGPADYLDATCGILVSPVPRAGFPTVWPKRSAASPPTPGCAKGWAALAPPRRGRNMTGKRRWTGCWRFTPKRSEADL